MAEQPSEEYKALYKRGVEAARSGELDRARKLFRAAIALEPGQKYALLALAKLEKDPTQKAKYYARVLRLDPKDRVARAYIQGLRAAAKRRRRFPRMAWALVGLAVLLLFGGALVVTASQLAGRLFGPEPTLMVLPSALPDMAEASPVGQPGDVGDEEDVLAEAGGLPGTAGPDQPQALVTEWPTPTLSELYIPSPTTSPEYQSPPPASDFPFPTPTLPPDMPPPPTAPLDIPPPSDSYYPTPTQPIIMTIPVETDYPTATEEGAPTPTDEPLFLEISPIWTPTEIPEFATPTEGFPDYLDTEVPPTENPDFEEDPYSGGGYLYP